MTAGPWDKRRPARTTRPCSGCAAPCLRVDGVCCRCDKEARRRRPRKAPARAAPAPPADDGHCHAWHPAHGRCTDERGHYAPPHQAAPSPHRAADGHAWFSVARDGAAVVPAGTFRAATAFGTR